MNTKILQKILDELQLAEPRIDYVVGMLETLIEMQEDKPVMISGNLPFSSEQVVAPLKKAMEGGDEAAILDAKARAALQTVNELTRNGTIATEQP